MGWDAVVILEGGPADGQTVQMDDRRSRINVEADEAATEAGFRAIYTPTKRKGIPDDERCVRLPVGFEGYPIHRFDGWSRVLIEIPVGA